VAAQDEGRDVLDRDVELLRDERPEAGRVEHAGHADDALLGKPERRNASWAMASSGFVTMMRIAVGDRRVVSATTPPTISAFFMRRSSRLIPGFRARPAVITMMSDPAVGS
jgi:hypothetical protein